MKLIESKAEYIPQEPGLEGIYKQIELAGRTAYKSEDKITPDSAKGFVDRMIKSNHGAALEHGTVYLRIPLNEWNEYMDYFCSYPINPYSKVDIEDSPDPSNPQGDAYITTNMRVLQDNSWLDDLQYLCEPTKYHEKRYTMKFTCDRGVSHELVRHRAFSFLQESTRYCNYSKDKFGNEVTFIKPSWISSDDMHVFTDYLEQCEKLYMDLISGIKRIGIVVMPGEKYTPQQARQVLPNALKTEVIMTGFTSDWRHFFDLRLFGKTGAPHPDMKLLAEKAQKAMQDVGIWNDIMSKPSKFE